MKECNKCGSNLVTFEDQPELYLCLSCKEWKDVKKGKSISYAKEQD